MSDVVVTALTAERISAPPVQRSKQSRNSVQNWPAFLWKPLHYPAVGRERMHEISTEICSLLDQQSKLLNSRRTLSDMNAAEIEAYAHRNSRIGQLAKELSEM